MGAQSQPSPRWHPCHSQCPCHSREEPGESQLHWWMCQLGLCGSLPQVPPCLTVGAQVRFRDGELKGLQPEPARWPKQQSSVLEPVGLLWKWPGSPIGPEQMLWKKMTLLNHASLTPEKNCLLSRTLFFSGVHVCVHRGGAWYGVESGHPSLDRTLVPAY